MTYQAQSTSSWGAEIYRSARVLGLALVALLGLPSAAAAATADADVRAGGEGTTVGSVTFRASPGEANRVTVTSRRSGLVFRDAAHRVTARGDCEQLDPHSALCPSSEDIADVHLGDRDDAALVVAASVNVMGGPGADVLRGSRDRTACSVDRALTGSPAGAARTR